MLLLSALIISRHQAKEKKEKDPIKGFCAYKLDLSKAYDRMDKDYLK
jgi:hypothetical protein